MTVQEHEDKYRNLNFKEYFDINNEEQINYKKIQEEVCIYNVTDEFLKDYNYLNKDNIQYNYENTVNNNIKELHKKYDFVKKNCFILETNSKIKFKCKFCDSKYYPNNSKEIFKKNYSICYMCFDYMTYENLNDKINNKKSLFS